MYCVLLIDSYFSAVAAIFGLVFACKTILFLRISECCKLFVAGFLNKFSDCYPKRGGYMKIIIGYEL